MSLLSHINSSESHAVADFGTLFAERERERERERDSLIDNNLRLFTLINDTPVCFSHKRQTGFLYPFFKKQEPRTENQDIEILHLGSWLFFLNSQIYSPNNLCYANTV